MTDTPTNRNAEYRAHIRALAETKRRPRVAR
jgi:ribonuclease HI